MAHARKLTAVSDSDNDQDFADNSNEEFLTLNNNINSILTIIFRSIIILFYLSLNVHDYENNKIINQTYEILLYELLAKGFFG